MARRNRKIRHISDISTHRQLCEARESLDRKLWYVEQRLADDLADTFSPESLLELIAPPGSAADRFIGNIRMGMATLRGVVNAVEYFSSRRR